MRIDRAVTSLRVKCTNCKEGDITYKVFIGDRVPLSMCQKCLDKLSALIIRKLITETMEQQ